MTQHGLSPATRVLDRSVPGPNNCIVWTGATTKYGHGVIRVSGKNLLVHGVVWLDRIGPVPGGKFVDHRCTEARCVNTAHLRLLTHRENIQARVRMNRNNSSGYRGVTAYRGRWRAQVSTGGKCHVIGIFDTPEEAAEAARLGRLRLHDVVADSDRKALK